MGIAVGTDPPITTQELTKALQGVLSLLAWQTQLVQSLLQKIEPSPPPVSAPTAKTRRKKPKKPKKPRKARDARN